MKCLIGLGNPGKRYALTRHNIGYMVIDRIGQKLGLKFVERGFSSIASGSVPHGLKDAEPSRVLLAKPATYMNRSGVAVVEILEDFPILIQDVLVIHDDMDIPFGRIRFKRNGSSGGHKGVQSIIDLTGQCDFPRLKVGIGRPEAGTDPADYVLSTFDDGDLLSEVVETAACAAIMFLTSGLGQAMNQYNSGLILEELERK
ncbi:MAG: aminoacyl-tRNA hydrolase [Bacillota bacterium]|jgi:PTH1 family peptidyl-tRNA hydrolase|nr:aminoacyl-tRNA hydrolase [Candidatus Fermentithermobacillaceae bacterium]